MVFNPQDHITKIQGKEYLEVKWRILWFRNEHPKGRIDTDITLIDGLGYCKATVWDNDGDIIASGLATIRSDPKAKWAGRDIEKSETAAIGRALAIAGFGTQFTGDDMDEGSYLADSPVDRRANSANGASPSDGNSEETKEAWIDEVIFKTMFLYLNEHMEYESERQRESIRKRMKDKSNMGIHTRMSPDMAASIVLAYRVTQDLEIEVNEFPKALNGLSLKEYLAQEGKTLWDAWQAFLDYAKERKLDWPA